MTRSNAMLFLIICVVFMWGGGALIASLNVPKSYQAVIFDCDGILVDTEYLKFLAWQDALAYHGISFSVEEYMPLIGYSSNHILRLINESKQLELTDETIESKNHKYKTLQKKGVPPIEAMIACARYLSENKQQLGLKLGVASSASKEEIFFNLQQIGLENAFDLVISGLEDLNEYRDVEGKNKPKPYIYIEAAKRLKVSPEVCLVFEDTKAGVDAAAHAGMDVVAIPNRFTMHHDFSNAKRVLYSYEELPSLCIFQSYNNCTD